MIHYVPIISQSHLNSVFLFVSIVIPGGTNYNISNPGEVFKILYNIQSGILIPNQVQDIKEIFFQHILFNSCFVFQFPEKAGRSPRMTRRSGLMDFVQQCIIITINKYFNNMLQMTRTFPFFP